MNDLLIKTYDLEKLDKICFDTIDNLYTIEFANSRSIKIIKEDFDENELNKFISIIEEKCNCKVIQLDTIKTQIQTMDNNCIANNGALIKNCQLFFL